MQTNPLNPSDKIERLPTLPVQAQLARNMVVRRKILRINQKQLADLVGTSQGAIARLESGRGNPTVDLVQRIVNALDFDLALYVRPN